MSLPFQNLTEIKGGLSKKRVFRKYENNLTKIVIDFSKDEIEFEKFINVYNILKNVDISIPNIFEILWKKKLVIMEDFGDNNFDKIIDEKEPYKLLKLAVDNLIIIQNSLSSASLLGLKKYTYNDLKKEIGEFTEYYLPHKNINNFPIDDFYENWEKIFISYDFEFNSFVHKDFEYINLILLNKKNLHLKCGIIDFQSAFIGFKGWDLFSILENPRINFTRKYNESLIRYFYQNVYINSEFEMFRKQYYLLNLARQTRLLGRWVKIFNQSGEDYLKYILPTKKRIISSLDNIQHNQLKKIYESILIN